MKVEAVSRAAAVRGRIGLGGCAGLASLVTSRREGDGPCVEVPGVVGTMKKSRNGCLRHCCPAAIPDLLATGQRGDDVDFSPHKWRLHDVMFWGLFDDNTQNMIHTKAHVRRRQTLPPECGPWGAPREYRPRRRHSYDVSGRTRRRPSNMAWDYTPDRPSAGRPPTDESLTETTLK